MSARRNNKDGPATGDEPAPNSGVESGMLEAMREMFAGMIQDVKDDMGRQVGELGKRMGDMDGMIKEVAQAVQVVTTPAQPAEPAEPAAVVAPPAIRYREIARDLFDGKGDKTAAELFLSDLEAQYRRNTGYYTSPDDKIRVDEARHALSGSAKLWFENIAKVDPLFTSSYHHFVSVFKDVYMIGLRLERPLDALRRLRMKGQHDVGEYTREFNELVGKCNQLQLPVISLITDYRLGLERQLQADVESARVSQLGPMEEWGTLLQCQATAMALGTDGGRKTVKVAAASVVPEGDAVGRIRRNETREQAAQRMARQCGYEFCKRRGHSTEECNLKRGVEAAIAQGAKKG